LSANEDEKVEMKFEQPGQAAWDGLCCLLPPFPVPLSLCQGSKKKFPQRW
jgi:hypothetical protein